MKLICQLTLCLMNLEIAIQLLYGEEAINQSSVFHVEFLVDYGINTDLWLGMAAQLKFFLFDGSLIQRKLIVISVSSEDSQKNHKTSVSIILESPLGLLRYSSRPRVFLNQNKLTVIKQVLMENNLFKSGQCHFHLTKTYQAIPMIIQFYHESNFSFLQRLITEEKLFFWLEDCDIHISDQVLFCPVVPSEYEYNPDDGFIYRFWSERTADKAVFQINSYLAMISPGQCINIDKKEYIVTSIKHYIKQANNLNHNGLPYWNQVTLQSRMDAKLSLQNPEFQVPWCFQAKIESPSEYAHLDDQGRYLVKFLFDEAEDTSRQHSAFIARLQCFGDTKKAAEAMGTHFPLYDGTEVLINCIDGDLYQPIILGALMNSNHPSVVDRSYPNKNVMLTANACGLVLDDAEQRSVLSVPGHSLVLDQKQQKIDLMSEQGGIQFYSEQDTLLSQGANALAQIDGQFNIVADQKAELTQVNQDLFFQSARDFNALASNDLVMQANTMQLNALDQLIFSAATIKQLLQQGKQIWQVKNTLIMKTKRIQLKSERLIVLSCINSAIQITPDKISFFSKTIEIDVKECRVQANHSNFNDQNCELFKVAVVQSISDLKALPFVRDEQDLVIVDCHWSQAQARIDDEVYAQCFVKNIGESQSGELIIYCENHQIVSKQSFSIANVRDQLSSQHANLCIPWRVSENDLSKKLAYQEKVLYYFDVEINGMENQEASSPLQIIVDLNIAVSYQGFYNVPDKSAAMVVSANKRSSLAFVHSNKALAKDILVGKLELSLAIMMTDKQYKQQLVYNDQQKIPWSTIRFKLPADLKSQQATLKSILPPLFVRLDDRPAIGLANAGDQVLSAQTLLELKKSCRDKSANITLFIHGYDVVAGKLGQCIESIEKEDGWSWVDRKIHFQSDDGLTVNFSDVDASVYQELADLQQRFSVIKGSADFLERYSINGSGDCAWLLAIEYYFNKACGLGQKGYDYYQRMIGVFWPAIPSSDADYIEVTNRIRIIGQKTAVLIRQLLNANFEVNIVAHSLGCGVAMQALNQLGQDKSSTKKIKNCFLWEAAVPNNIFSTRGYDSQKKLADIQLLMERDHWYVPYAKEASEKFIILHSKNDNILGPIPKEQASGKDQFYINSKKPFLSELVPAVLLTFLGLESIYDVAMTLNVPTRDVINQACFSRIYTQWWQHYHPIQDKKGRFYPDTLDKRIKQLSDAEFTAAKNCIADQYQKNKTIIHRYIDAARKSCSDTDITGYADVEFLTDHPGLIEDYFIFDLSPSTNQMDPEANQKNYDFNYAFYVKLPVLISSLFFDNNMQYPKALGYQGIDVSDPVVKQLLDEGKLEQIDQTDCLFSHSGMKNPSKELFQKIYQQAIWQNHPEFHFGGY